MSELDNETIFKIAKDWVYEAGKNIINRIDGPMRIDSKADENDLVTEIDKETEIFFSKKIKSTFPDHLLLSEEGYGDNIKSLDGTIWITDPIDGTMNFVHLKRDFAISLAVYVDGVGEFGIIYDVIADVMYTGIRGQGAYKNDEKLEKLNTNVQLSTSIFAFNHDLLCESDSFDRKVMDNLVRDIRGTRTLGAAAIDIARVAEGVLDGFISSGLSPWDVAAGQVILDEVGGITLRATGENLNMLEFGTILSCNKSLAKKVVDNYLKHWERP